MYDYVYLCKAVYRYVYLCIAMYSCVWLCIAMYIASYVYAYIGLSQPLYDSYTTYLRSMVNLPQDLLTVGSNVCDFWIWKGYVFTHKLTRIFIKSILVRKFCIQTINWQKQIAREISVELQSVTLSLNSKSVTSLEVGRLVQNRNPTLV